MIKYKAKEGSMFTNKLANIYGNCIAQIEKEKGTVKPKDVVEVAKKIDSPLHDYFDWNNASAADKYRLSQARYLMNHLVIDIEVEGRIEEQNAFVSLAVEKEDGGKGYLSMDKAMSVSIYREQVLDVALREYDYWEKKYNTLKELALLFKAREALKRKLSK